MVETFEPVKHSPVSGLPAPDGGISLAERPFIAKVNLRGDPDSDGFIAGVKQTLDMELPIAPNTTHGNGRHTVFWLGPNEWLVHGPEDTQSEIVATLRGSLGAVHTAITDVTDYYAVLRLSGPKAREVLSKGTPFDVHQHVFSLEACAQTCFGHASILLHHVQSSPVFDIQVRWTFAEYVWMYLVDAAKEYA